MTFPEAVGSQSTASDHGVDTAGTDRLSGAVSLSWDDRNRSGRPGARSRALRTDATVRFAKVRVVTGRLPHTLCPDWVLDDLILVLMANSGIQATSPAARVAASRRFAALAIQAFRASPKHSPRPSVTWLAPAALHMNI